MGRQLPTVLSSCPAVIHWLSPSPVGHSVCSLAWKPSERLVARGLIKHVKRHLAFLTVRLLWASLRLAQDFGNGVRATSPGAHLDSLAWPGPGQGHWGPGPICRVPFSLKLCPSLVREEEKGLLRPFYSPAIGLWS